LGEAQETTGSESGKWTCTQFLSYGAGKKSDGGLLTGAHRGGSEARKEKQSVNVSRGESKKGMIIPKKVG